MGSLINEMKVYDLIIIGGGQAGLSMAYFIRRSNLNYLILDSNELPGGAWLHTWDSLKLFSPTEYSSLSGWFMPKSENEYPSKTEFIDYLTKYELRYDFQIERGIQVDEVMQKDQKFLIETNKGKYQSKMVVSATGTAKNPFIPEIEGLSTYKGLSIHSVDYKNPDPITGNKVLVVGGGNSGAQLLAELSLTKQTTWATLHEPNFLPDDVDGRYLFNQANSVYHNKEKSTESLADIVMIESVRDARRREVLNSRRMFSEITEDGVVWDDGSEEQFDAIVWCTGFKPNLSHLESMDVVKNNRIRSNGTKSVDIPSLWLLGYGNWTGFASATIYGVGKTARDTAKQIESYYQTIVDSSSE